MQSTFSKPVFFSSVLIIVVAVISALVLGTSLGTFFADAVAFLTGELDEMYMVTMSIFLIFVVGIGLSPWGKLRLGDAAPEFGRPTWFAMLFSAGMGIGLMFYGVAEPITHFSSLREVGLGADEARTQAMAQTFMHWGLHPWACYSLVGLALAYFSFRKGKPLAIRSAFYPLMGERIHGPIGHTIDTLAIVSTMFGVATSLGLGAMQVGAGLSKVFGLENTPTLQLLLIAGITLAATISVVSGIGKGIRRLSEVNMTLATMLVLFVAVAGPTGYIVSELPADIWAYLGRLPEHTFLQSDDWPGGAGYTVFYWAWWIAWSPFVGMFIARISRGRSIREFVLATLLVPTLLGIVWLGVFGNSALWVELIGPGGLVASVEASVPKSLFSFLEALPAAGIASVVATVCIVLFFVTSSDSASLVIDTIASGGQTNPPVWQRVFWAVAEGAVAAALLVGGGLGALQSAAISSALPFAAVLLVMMIALGLALWREPRD